MPVAPERGKLDRQNFWPHDLVLGLLPLLIGVQALLWTIYLPLGVRGIADFRQFYTGGYMVRTGQANQLYDYDAPIEMEEKLVPVGAHFLLSLTHPAFEYLLFVPLSLLSYRGAYWVFMAFNCGLLVLCLRLLRFRLRGLSERWRWFPAFLLLAFYPVSRTLAQGQDSIIMLALLAGTLLALDFKKETLAGLVLGIGIFKFQIAIPIALLFFAWRRWRFLLGFGVSSSVAAAISVWIVRLSGAKAYLRVLLSMSTRLNSRADVFRDPTTPLEMLNVRGLISAILHWASPVWIQLAILLASAIILFFAARKQASLPLAIIAASLVSYHFIAHDASVLIIPIFTALSSHSLRLGVTAAVLLIAPLAAVVPEYGYLAAIPLLALFVLSISSQSGEPRSWQTQAC